MQIFWFYTPCNTGGIIDASEEAASALKMENQHANLRTRMSSY